MCHRNSQDVVTRGILRPLSPSDTRFLIADPEGGIHGRASLSPHEKSPFDRNARADCFCCSGKRTEKARRQQKTPPRRISKSNSTVSSSSPANWQKIGRRSPTRSRSMAGTVMKPMRPSSTSWRTVGNIVTFDACCKTKR